MPATAAQLAALQEFFGGAAGGRAGVAAGVSSAVKGRVIGRVQVRPVRLEPCRIAFGGTAKCAQYHLAKEEYATPCPLAENAMRLLSPIHHNHTPNRRGKENTAASSTCEVVLWQNPAVSAHPRHMW